MRAIPQDKGLDNTLGLLRDGYCFISKHARRNESDVFKTRLFLHSIICMRGEEAAKVFYDEDLFERKDAAPKRVLKTLFGQGGVQGLDGDAHHHRKQMFMSLMTPEGIERLSDLMAEHWRAYLARWERQEKVVLLDEVEEILTRAVCQWTGVPLADSEVKQRTQEFTAMIESAGAIGPKHWQGRRARHSDEEWVRGLIEQVRTTPDGEMGDTVLHRIAWHQDLNGRLLDSQIAAVELINVLRPTVAVGRFITFAALALHEHPEHAAQMVAADDAEVERFVQEVRRFYPFFPFVGARVRREFEWQGYRLPKGATVVLDLYGTDHDERIWKGPDEFRPERFLDWDGSAFNFIPQGGGDYYIQHRCPGEWIAIALMKRAVRLLTTAMSYAVPPQDLHISMTKMPTAPNSGFVMNNLRRSA